jgi:2-polyprenyl-6-methoxyphenol hydroxylase-like FAD-dependent oxidoreductase
MFLGYLLARSGVAVTVLEKHADFLRDFRGDTIHPSTLQLMDELGLLDEILRITDFQTKQLWLNFNGRQIAGPTFSHLKTKCRFIGFVPQWDFLNLLSQEASRFGGFDLRMSTRAIDVIREHGRVAGVRCESDGSEFEIRADLVIGADGRSSTIRAVTDCTVHSTGVPIDALWFRLDRPSHDDGHTLGWMRNGHMLVTIPRRSHYQIAMVIRKGSFDQLKSKGITGFRESIRSICPPLKDVVSTLVDWDEVRLLTVQINHLSRWYEDGLLFIGDSAHAMSPMGGVGINLAIQDAVAAANRLVAPLKSGTLSMDDLQAIQARREPAARKTQRLQARAHAMLFGAGSDPDQAFSIPWSIKTVAWLLAPLLRRISGRWIGIGFRPEHIETTAVDD